MIETGTIAKKSKAMATERAKLFLNLFSFGTSSTIVVV
jgi:hypothetical protein